MLTCRSRFATRFLNDAAVCSRFSFVVELSPWNKAATSAYIKQFCRQRHCQALAPDLNRAFKPAGGMTEIGTNPDGLLATPAPAARSPRRGNGLDRKSTRLNSSHLGI